MTRIMFRTDLFVMLQCVSHVVLSGGSFPGMFVFDLLQKCFKSFIHFPTTFSMYAYVCDCFASSFGGFDDAV